MMVTNVGVKK